MEVCWGCNNPGVLHEARIIEAKYGLLSKLVKGRFCSYSCYDNFNRGLELKDAMNESFPEHEHVWEVVLIENNPVGVSCKICDETFHTSKERPELTADDAMAYLDLRANAIVKMRNGANTFLAVIDSIEQRAEINSDMEILVRFRIPGLKLPAPDPYAMASYSTTTANLGRF